MMHLENRGVRFMMTCKISNRFYVTNIADAFTRFETANVFGVIVH